MQRSGAEGGLICRALWRAQGCCWYYKGCIPSHYLEALAELKPPAAAGTPLRLGSFFPHWGFIESFDGRGGFTGQGRGAFTPSTGRDTGESGRHRNLPWGCHLARDLRVCVRGTTRGTRATRTRATRHCLPTTRWGQDNRLQRKQRLGVPRVGGNHPAPSGRTYHSWSSHSGVVRIMAVWLARRPAA